MNKEERIKRYGKAAYEKLLQQNRDWHAQHRKEHNITSKRWYKANPEKAKANNQEVSRKGGERYEKALIYRRIGIPGEKARIRRRHRTAYQSFKRIIAPDSEIQHEWLPGTAKYRGVALVEAKPHRYGIIKVIKILEGEITLFTEKEIAKQGGN